MSEKVIVAGIQIDSKILEKERNLDRCLNLIRIAAGKDARLIVFPECMLTGYIFNSLDEAKTVAETIPGPSIEKIIDVWVSH